MKSNLSPESEGAAGPSIAVLAEPSPLQVAQDRVAELEKQVAELTAREAALSNKNAVLAEKLEVAGKRIRDFETNPLSYALSNLDAGGILEQAGKQLDVLTASVIKQSQKGKFTFSLTVKPFEGGALVFVPEVRISEPKPEPKKSIFFRPEDGGLTRDDPKQMELGIGGNREDAALARERANPNLR